MTPNGTSDSQAKNGIFKGISFCFALAAVFHLIRFLAPGVEDSNARSGHLCFVFIDLAFAILFHIQVRGLILLFIPFVAEQFYQHGGRLLSNSTHFMADFIVDAGVLVFLTFVLGVLIRQRKERRPD